MDWIVVLKMDNGVESFTTVLLTAMNVLIRFFISLDENMGAIFVHELYLCTYKMERREQQYLNLSKNALFSLLMVIVITGVDEGIVQISRIFLPVSSTWVGVLRSTMPTKTAKNIGITVVFVFLACHVLYALEKSRRFRAKRGSGKSGVSFLSVLVGTMTITQLARLGINVAMAWINSLSNQDDEWMRQCMDEDDLESQDEESWKCLKEYRFTDYLMYCSFAEFMFVFLYTAYQRMSKFCFGNQA